MTNAGAQGPRLPAGGSLDLRKVGALSAAVYLLTFLFYLRGPEAHTRTGRELFAWFISLSLLFLFWKGYRRVERSDDVSEFRTIVGFGALFCLLAICIFPFHSTDIFGYINRGWQQVHYGQNPYVFRLADVPQWQQDPMLREHWLYNPDPYGFLFTLLSRFLCQAGGGNWWATLFLFKALNAMAYAATAWLVWAGAKTLGLKRPVVALYLFLWNPLVLMHLVANGHNDILVGCLVVLALYLAARGAALWVVPVLVAATLLKYAPALLIPPALIFIVKNKGWKTAALGSLLGLLVLVAASAPYLSDWGLFKLADIQDNATLIDNSLHSLLIHLFENAARLFPSLAQFHADADAAIRTTIRGGFLVFFAVQVFRVLKDSSVSSLVEKSSLIMFALVCVASSKFNAWYVGMLLPPALLLEERHWLRRLTVLVSCTELLSLTFFKQAYMLNYAAMILAPSWLVYRQVRKGKASARAAGDELQAAPPFDEQNSVRLARGLGAGGL